MEVLIEIPRTELGEAVKLQKEYPDNVDIHMTKKFEGSLEVIGIIVTLTSTFAPIAYDFFMKRKPLNKPGTIKIDGVEYEYDSKAELEQILESAMNNEEE